MIQTFRKHAGKEERVIANVLAHLALAVKGSRGPIDRIRFQEHFTQIAQGASLSVPDLVQRFRYAELGQQVGDIRMHFRVAHTHLVIVAFNYLLKKPLQRTRFRNHLNTPFRAMLFAPGKTPSPPGRKHQQLGNAD
jgi:hypothetical protein